MFSRFISLPVFLISLAIGLLFVYLSSPAPTAIFVYPTPDNAGQIHYKDKAGTCFKFDSHEVMCPKDGSAKTIPAQN
jgi:hypothetical protein